MAVLAMNFSKQTGLTGLIGFTGLKGPDIWKQCSGTPVLITGFSCPTGKSQPNRSFPVGQESGEI
jgi:hypothetical protein